MRTLCVEIRLAALPAIANLDLLAMVSFVMTLMNVRRGQITVM